MDRIIFRLKFFGISCLLLVFSMGLLIYGCFSGHICGGSFCIITALAILVNLLLAGSFALAALRHYSEFRRAQIIMENQLFNICAAEAEDVRDVSIILSPFGVLVGDKVVPFDADKDRLYGIELDRNSTIIIYGRPDKKKKLKIPRIMLTEKELMEFTEKLNFETGVMLGQPS